MSLEFRVIIVLSSYSCANADIEEEKKQLNLGVV
jgi:hypothetical protein